MKQWINLHHVSYEPADLTDSQSFRAPPPQKKNIYILRAFYCCTTVTGGRCLVPPFFPKNKLDFVENVCIGTHKNVVLRHNHSNPISTKLFDFTGFMETKKLH